MRLTFRGAARTVTGSMHQLEADGMRYLLDCGMFQGRRKEAEERNRGVPAAAGHVDTVVLSHAHIDHSGNLPLLVKHGYRGPIFSTPASIDLCGAMLLDTAHIQEKDAEFLNKRRNKRNGEEVQPMYETADAQATLPLMQPVEYHKPRQIGDSLSYEAYDAGHMLGSSAIVLHHKMNGKAVRLAFSGDVGRPNLAIIRDPEPLPPVEYLIMESTYGGRLHKDNTHVERKLADVIRRTAARGGKVVAPAFAVGRTQQLVVLLHQLSDHGEIPNIPIFVDSPLAVNVTQVYRDHTECFDEETSRFLREGENPFGFKRLQYIREAADSKKLNDLHGPFVVISASGMCEAGRILHHLRNNVEDPRNTVLITGYQAPDTLGRKLVEKQREVKIFGEPFTVRAEVSSLDELSGHADQHELMDWLRPLAEHLKHVFLVHGEVPQAEVLAGLIREKYGIPVSIPAPGESFELS